MEGKNTAQGCFSGCDHTCRLSAGSLEPTEAAGWFLSVPGWGASWCPPRCRWWGTSGCNAWTAPHRARSGTSRSSRPRRFCRPGSRGWVWGRSSGRCARRRGRGASPSGTRTEDERPSRSHLLSAAAETWARTRFQGGHTSETAGFHHFCSSPAEAEHTIMLNTLTHLIQ